MVSFSGFVSPQAPQSAVASGTSSGSDSDSGSDSGASMSSGVGLASSATTPSSSELFAEVSLLDLDGVRLASSPLSLSSFVSC